MVRKLVGAVLDVASGKATLNDVKKSLDCDSDKQFSTVLASGLYLAEISYDKV